jgi:hypothetical protein
MPITNFMTRFYHSFSQYLKVTSRSGKLISIFQLSLLVLAAGFVNSCEEGTTIIGNELLPGSDYVRLFATDTLSVRSYTVYDTHVATNDPSTALVGSIYDPYYGTTTAEFVSQLRLAGAWTLGPVTVDSVKLMLKFLTVTGGSTTEGNYLRLTEISDQIYTDSLYYSDTHTDTTDFSYTVQLPVLQADTINNVSVSLPIQFGEYLIRDTTKLFYSTIKPDFRSFFKGLYFRISNGGTPLMLSFSTVSEVPSGGSYNNYLLLYVHDTAYVKSRYYLILDAVHPNACYNKIIRDFSTADPEKKIEHLNDLTYLDTLSYLQYLDGVYTRLVFPGLDSLKKILANTKFSINKARITLPVYFDNDKFTPSTVPANLYLRYTNTDGDKFIVPDYSIGSTGSAFYDGTLHSADSTYYFNIPTFIQRYLMDTENAYKPELDIAESIGSLKSAIFKANKAKTPIKFELTYTKY